MRAKVCYVNLAFNIFILSEVYFLKEIKLCLFSSSHFNFSCIFFPFNQVISWLSGNIDIQMQAPDYSYTNTSLG